MGRQQYSPEFRAEAVRLVVEYARPVAVVAGELGVHEGSLRTWLSRAKKEKEIVVEKRDEDLTVENARLRAELAEKDRLLRLKEQETEFLKKAASFFARELDPEPRSRRTGTR